VFGFSIFIARKKILAIFSEERGIGMNYSLDTNQSSELLWALCRDVETLRASDGKKYVYFRLRKLSELPVVKYILKSNGVKSNLHFTRYYKTDFGFKTLIVRASLWNSENDLLKNVKSKRSADKKAVAKKVPCVFPLLSRGLKNRVIANLHENVK